MEMILSALAGLGLLAVIFTVLLIIAVIKNF